MAGAHYSYAREPQQERWHIYSYDGQGQTPAALCGYLGPTTDSQATPPAHPFTYVCVACRDAAPPELQEDWRRRDIRP